MRSTCRAAAAVCALALAATACAGASGADTTAAAVSNPVETPVETPAETPVETPVVVEPAATVQLPAVDVVSLATGETADLSSFSRPGATLVWFWAPH